MAVFHLKIAESAEDFQQAKILFEEYARSLHFDLAYQDFNKELDSISRQYVKPDGALILGYLDGDVAIGCAGVRKLEESIAELKRLYVQPEYRGMKIGQKLLEAAIQTARSLGYKSLRLDTVPGQEKAQQLYYFLGFYQIPSYRYSPIEGTLCLEKILGEDE